MKKDVHPQYFDQATVTCACGNTFTIGSTVEKIEVEVCSACHPFFTGKEKMIDTAGRVEKFRDRQSRAKSKTKFKTRVKTQAKNKSKEIAGKNQKTQTQKTKKS